MADFTVPEIPEQQSVVPIAQKFSEFSSGAGSTKVQANKEGFFAGGSNFETAAWKLDYATGINYVGAGNEITIDGQNKKIVVGTGDDIVMDGSTGYITTDKIKDKTYGLNGVFCITHTSVSTSGTYSWNTGIPANGGLLTASLNYIDGSGYYKWLPGYNSTTAKSYFYVKKEDGVYKFWYSATNIYSDVTYTTLYFTMMFNSLEASGW